MGLSQRQKAVSDFLGGSGIACPCPAHPIESPNLTNEVRINVLSHERGGAEGKRRWFRFTQLALSVVLFHVVMMVCNLLAPRFITSEKLKGLAVSGCWLIFSMLFIWCKSRVDKRDGFKSTRASVLAQSTLHVFSLFLFSNLEHIWSESEFFSLLLAHATTSLLELGGSLTIMWLLQVDVDMEGSDL